MIYYSDQKGNRWEGILTMTHFTVTEKGVYYTRKHELVEVTGRHKSKFTGKWMWEGRIGDCRGSNLWYEDGQDLGGDPDFDLVSPAKDLNIEIEDISEPMKIG